MRNSIHALLILFGTFSIVSCGSREVEGSYRFYDEFHRPGRSFERVMACDPSNPDRPFCSDVLAYELHSRAIHIRLLNHEEDTVFGLFHANKNGFDCIDDTRSSGMSWNQYMDSCEHFGYPILLTETEQ